MPRARRLLLALTLAASLLPACGRAPRLEIPRAERPLRILAHPAVEAAADDLERAAAAAVAGKLAPDASQRLLLSPLAGEGSVWESSALTWSLAGRDGRLRPYPTEPPLLSVPAIQAWLRGSGSSSVVWVVEGAGAFSPDLRLVAVSADRVWRSGWVTVRVPPDERVTWPLSPDENPPLARLEVDAAERLTEDAGRLYVQGPEGLREIEWLSRRGELRLKDLQPWEKWGRSWITRNVGLPADPSPALALLRRELRLELRDADLPRGEGDLWSWSISRGGAGLRLPLVRADAVEILALAAAPSGWALEETWLVLRAAPSGATWIEMYRAPLRRLPRPAGTPEPSVGDPVRVAADVDGRTLEFPFGLAPLDLLERTHRRPRPLQARPGWIRYDPLFEWLAPLELLPGLDGAELPERRTAAADRIHLLRFSALEEDFPVWRAAMAHAPLVLGDRSRWRGVAAAPLFGVARIRPDLSASRRRALARWLAGQDAFTLFGLEREELRPRLPLTRSLRPVSGAGAPELPPRLGLRVDGCPGLLDPLPPAWREELRARLSALLARDGCRLEPGAVGPGHDGCDLAAASGDDGDLLVVQVARLLAPVDAAVLLARLGLEEEWPGPDPPTADPGAVEAWLLEEGYLVPLWTEPGLVFVDRRVAGLRPDSTLLLPDLREARLLPAEALAPFDLLP